MPHRKKKGPDASNIWPLNNINTRDSAIDNQQHKPTSEKLQAVSFANIGENNELPARIIAKRHRLAFPTAKLICTLSGIGGRI